MIQPSQSTEPTLLAEQPAEPQDPKDTAQEKQTEKQIIATLFKEKSLYEQATQANRKELVDIYNAYSGNMDQVKKLPYETKETVPKMRTEIAYVKSNIFSGQPEIEIEGVGDEDKTVAMILEKIVNFRFQTIPQFYEKVEDWVHQACTFGTSLLQVVWKFETKDNGDGTETPICDEPDILVPNIMDTFYNPMISEVNPQVSLIRRAVLPEDDIKNNSLYDYAGEDGTLNREKVVGKGNFAKNIYDSSSQINAQALQAQAGMVEVYERETKDRIQTIADGQKRLVLRDIENPDGFIHFNKFVFEKDTIPNTFDGKGVGHNTLGLGKMFYSLFNQTLQSVKLGNNPMFLFKKGAGIDARQLVAKPGGGISVDGDGPLQDNIQPVIFPDIKTGAINLLQKIDDEHKRASGATDVVQGSSGANTLGQDQMAMSNTSIRFELIQRRFKHSLADVANMIIKMELRNLQSPDAPILRIFPQEMRQQVYELLISEAQDVKYNIKVKGDTTVARNKDLESKRLTELFNLATAANSPVQLTPVEARAFLRRLAERQGEPNIDEIIGEKPPMPQIPIDPQTGQPMPPMPGMPPQGQPQGAVPNMMPPIGSGASQQGLNQGVGYGQ